MRRPRFQDTTLFMTLALWLCTLPVLLLIAPRFIGWELTWYLAAALLLGEILACWIVCRLPTPDKGARDARNERNG